MGQMTVKQYLTEVQTSLSTQIQNNMSALPKDFNSQRFTLNCMAMMKDKLNDFSGIKVETVVQAFLKGAFLGLDFFNGECYAIAYKGDCNFQTDYKGEIKLAKKYSKSHPIKNIYAKNVREGDIFETYIEKGEQVLNFRPKPFNNAPILGTFAVVYFEDGSMIYDTMSVEEINEVRENYSKAANSPAWKKSPGEMYKKTVLRRLLKLVDLDFDNTLQNQAFIDGGDFDAEKAKSTVPRGADAGEPSNLFGTNDDSNPDIIDGEFREVEDMGMDIEEA